GVGGRPGARDARRASRRARRARRAPRGLVRAAPRRRGRRPALARGRAGRGGAPTPPAAGAAPDAGPRLLRTARPPGDGTGPVQHPAVPCGHAPRAVAHPPRAAARRAHRRAPRRPGRRRRRPRPPRGGRGHRDDPGGSRVNDDAEFDLVVVGSGGGGMVASLAAADAGASVVVLEKRELIGGSTAMSGGVVWITDPPLLRADGVAGSYDDAMAHFEVVVGDVGPCSSPERRHAFLTSGPEMVEFLQREGVRFERCAGYSDYYSDEKGGLATGRSIEPAPWDGRALGDLLPSLQPGLAAGVGLAVKTDEVRTLAHWNRTPGAFATAARVVLRSWAAKARRKALLTYGAALIGQLLATATARGGAVWTQT